MQRGLRIAKIFGININIDSSWFLIFFLITWNLSELFREIHRSWSMQERWGLALIGALLFFASVLVHELAHSLMAKVQGVNVRSITLHLFGGVSNIEREPPSPGAEFLITIVGPISSAIIGVIFTLLAGARAPITSQGIVLTQNVVSRLSPLRTLFLWLGPINVLLAVFNLVPGFPLDGGRILRSLLWALTNNLKRATRWAAMVGQAVAWALIAGGLWMVFGNSLPFFGKGLIGGLWLAFIGWFLNSAAAGSYEQMLLMDMLEDVPVRRLMHKNSRSVPSELSLDDLVDEYFLRSDERSYPVTKEEHLVGVISIDDLQKVPKGKWQKTIVAKVMTPLRRLKSLRPEQDTAAALNRLRELNVRQLPVMENEELLGFLRQRDILRWLELRGDLPSREGRHIPS